MYKRQPKSTSPSSTASCSVRLPACPVPASDDTACTADAASGTAGAAHPASRAAPAKRIANPVSYTHLNRFFVYAKYVSGPVLDANS